MIIIKTNHPIECRRLESKLVRRTELSKLMIKSSSFLLLLLSTSLFWSPAIFSQNDSIEANDTDSAVPLQLSMLTEPLIIIPQDEDSSQEIVETADAPLEEDNPEASNELSSLPATAATSELSLYPRFTDEEIAHLRQIFLQAEVSVDSDDDGTYFTLAEQLKDYPLYPYLQYRWLKTHLDDETQVKFFLQQNSASRYAGPLKRQWLSYLAKQKQWATFLQFYEKTSDASLNCYYHQAQYDTGDKRNALSGAKNLWVVGESQPKACDVLFGHLKKSGLFNRDLFWQRFDAALRNNKTSLATYVKGLMTPADRKTAQLWLNLHHNPDRYLPALLNHPKTAQTPLMFSHAINRLAGKDVNRAISLWDENKQKFNLSEQLSNKLEKRLALSLAYKNEDGAYERLGQLNNSDNNSKTQRIRVALYEQNWPRVINAILDLSEAEQKLEKWQYWLARGYQETGKLLQADELLSDLSSKRDFYGYLAADRLNRLYQLSDNPTVVTQAEIDAIKNRAAFRVAFEFMVLDRSRDAKLQWWHAVRQLDKSQIPAAAKLAQRWQWDEIAIFTIAKAQQWDDIEMRFPLSYSEKIHENAIEQNLNPMILFGLVRRESAFNKDANSPVGARGLMQIMPQTGKQIAKDLNEHWLGKDDLFNPATNLRYGSYYYQKLLRQFNGNYAIALAAYNAGPSRVKRWLPDESIPADIWIETIPYRETRDYVTSVLVYAMIYQQRMQSNALTMNDLTREVLPLAMLP